jgi:hypothetical protein
MWTYKTNAGSFFIIESSKWFHAVFEDERLGSYVAPERAADKLSGGLTLWPSSGINPGELGIPDDLSKWDRLIV